MGPDIDMKFHQEVMEIVSYDNCNANFVMYAMNKGIIKYENLFLCLE